MSQTYISCTHTSSTLEGATLKYSIPTLYQPKSWRIPLNYFIFDLHDFPLSTHFTRLFCPRARTTPVVFFFFAVVYSGSSQETKPCPKFPNEFGCFLPSLRRHHVVLSQGFLGKTANFIQVFFFCISFFFFVWPLCSARFLFLNYRHHDDAEAEGLNRIQSFVLKWARGDYNMYIATVERFVFFLFDLIKLGLN